MSFYGFNIRKKPKSAYYSYRGTQKYSRGHWINLGDEKI